MNILGVSWLRFGLAAILVSVLCYVLRDDPKNLVGVLIPTVAQLLLIDLSFRKELKEKQLQLNEIEEVLKKIIVKSRSEDFVPNNPHALPDSQNQEELSTSYNKTYIKDAYDNLLSQGSISKGLYKHLMNRLNNRGRFK